LWIQIENSFPISKTWPNRHFTKNLKKNVFHSLICGENLSQAMTWGSEYDKCCHIVESVFSPRNIAQIRIGSMLAVSWFSDSPLTEKYQKLGNLLIVLLIGIQWKSPHLIIPEFRRMPWSMSSYVILDDHGWILWLTGRGDRNFFEKVVSTAVCEFGWVWGAKVDVEASECLCSEFLDRADRDARLTISIERWNGREIDAGPVTVIRSKSDQNIGLRKIWEYRGNCRSTLKVKTEMNMRDIYIIEKWTGNHEGGWKARGERLERNGRGIFIFEGASSQVFWTQTPRGYEIRANHILSFGHSPKSPYFLRKAEIFARYSVLDRNFWQSPHRTESARYDGPPMSEYREVIGRMAQRNMRE
jgi:hypothetical protein